MILAIETSCDDSAVALLAMDGTVVASEISSQVALHEKFGGIVPEIASRKHLMTLPLLLRYILERHSVQLKDLKAVAVTYAPGLIGSLLVGVSYAKSLAWLADLPLIPVDHLEGHLLAPFLDHPDLAFPYLALIASGGHTHLIVAKGLADYRLIGKTLDDAAGEAYDKVAKMLGFKYPGGPIVERLANDYKNPDIAFPIPLKGRKSLDFSFSGLKTAVRNEALKNNVYVTGKRLISYEEFIRIPESGNKAMIKNIAASFQQIMTKIIIRRFQEALKTTGLKRMIITGGVASNHGIRTSLRELAEKEGKDFYCPDSRNCTDNAAMIGFTALQHLTAGRNNFKNTLKLNASARSPIGLMDVDH